MNFSPQKATQVLIALEQAATRGAAPFLSVAAESCGLDPEAVAQWYQLGRTQGGKFEKFFTGVARRQSEWKMLAQQKIMTATKDDGHAVKGLKYLLECMDREVFGLRQVKVKTNQPPPPAPMGLSAALDALGAQPKGDDE